MLPNLLRRINLLHKLLCICYGKAGIVYRYDSNDTTYYLEAIRDDDKLINKQTIKVGLGEVPEIQGLVNAIKAKNTNSFPADAADVVPRMHVQDVGNGFSSIFSTAGNKWLRERNKQKPE